LEIGKPLNSFFRKIGLANIIATCTLLLTIATFYYQYWRVAYDLNATIIALKPNCNGAELATDVIFTNNGNRQSAIVKLSMLTRTYSSEDVPKKDQGGWSLMESNEAPFSVNPNDVISKRLSFGQEQTTPIVPISNILNMASGKRAQLISDYKFVIVVVASDGKCHEIVSDILVQNNKTTSEYDVSRLPLTLKLIPSPVTLDLQSYVSPQRRN
jgi:hypothetical protein